MPPCQRLRTSNRELKKIDDRIFTTRPGAATRTGAKIFAVVQSPLRTMSVHPESRHSPNRLTRPLCARLIAAPRLWRSTFVECCPPPFGRFLRNHARALLEQRSLRDSDQLMMSLPPKYNVRRTQMPGQTALDDSAIVERAKNNLQRALNSTETVAIPQSDARWLAYSQWARQEIPLLRTVNEAVAFAQLRFGFESRATTHLRHRARLKAIREKLRREFPHADDHTTAFTESQFSARNTCLMSDGRLVSSQLLNLVRFHLTAVAHTPPADTVCEIGGGYGAPARIWMTSPVRRPKKYIIVDLPESLFFAEVFLRAHFGDRVSNVAETQHFDLHRSYSVLFHLSAVYLSRRSIWSSTLGPCRK
jgi:putative sugar O-methyltransferase